MLLSEKQNSPSFKESIQGKVLQPDALESTCKALKAEGKTIATLNGSFDLLHPGHFEMIYQASCQADVFILLLNSDASIQSYKNPNRPINPLEVRLQQIAALGMVDYVSWFEETDPCSVLEKIKPDVHVNGSEYGEACIEASVVERHGGKIHVVSLVDGYSSSNLIRKIRELCD